MKSATRHGPFKIPGNAAKRNPIEDYIQLEDYAVFKNLPGSPGAAILSKGLHYQFRFCFRIDGVHPTLPLEQMETICSYIENSIKSMPDGETLSIVQTVRPDNSRLDYYQELLNNAPNPLFEAMVESAALPHTYFPVDSKHRAYKKKEIFIYVSASSSTASDSKDKTEALLASFLGNVSGIFSRNNVVSQASRITECFVNAGSIYDDWLNLLGQMRLNVQPLSLEELVAIQWREFNDTQPRRLPQWIEWDGINLNYHQTHQTHISTWFFEHQACVPKAQSNCVVQSTPSGARSCAGVVSLKNKPAGWTDCKDQLGYLYLKANFLERYSIVLTMTKASSFLIQRNIEMLQRQSIDAQKAAEKRNLPSTRSTFLQEQADDAASGMMQGNIPVKMSLCFIVHEPTKDLLKQSCRKLQSQFLQPATLEVEEDYAYITWLQSFPQLSYSGPLFKPFERSDAYLASEIPAFMPVMKVTSPDKRGLEFVTEDEGTPYYLDIARVHRHILFLAITRSGKSVLFAQILMIAMCSKIPMVIVDYPREDGESTFGPITRLAGKDGAYLNIAEESNNILELPDLSAFEEEERDRRLIEIKDYILDALMIIMYGGNATKDDREKRTAKSIFGNLIERFYSDPEIQSRFSAALGAPSGSKEWKNTPTLHDFTKLCTESTLRELLETTSEEHIQLINEIKLRFLAFMQTTVGKSMSSPTSIPPNAQLLVFAFKGISNDEDAAILMASAAAAAMRRTLAAPVSILFLDEASILSKFESLMAQTAKIAANGAKSGIRLMMALQTPASIARSNSGPEILANMATRIIGRVDSADSDNYSKILHIPKDVITINTSKAFYPNISELYSRWLISDRGEFAFLRSYAPPLLLAAVANNPDQEAAKAAFLECYGDSVSAMKAFAMELISSGQSASPLRLPQPSVSEVFANAS